MICPILAKCNAKVNLDHYRDICSNVDKDAFKDCEHYKKIASENKSPSEWQDFFRIT